jgi:NADH-quinone oxidoreductase subunit J
MDYTFVFAIISALALASALLLFYFRGILHAVLALTVVFALNSALFLFLDQPLLAVVQLFILVGGVSTFLFVGVASAELVQFKFSKMLLLVVLWAVLFIAIAYPMYRSGYTMQETGSNFFGPADIGSALSQSPAVFYAIMLMLFSVSLGAIIALKRMGGKK